MLKQTREDGYVLYLITITKENKVVIAARRSFHYIGTYFFSTQVVDTKQDESHRFLTNEKGCQYEDLCLKTC